MFQSKRPKMSLNVPIGANKNVHKCMKIKYMREIFKRLGSILLLFGNIKTIHIHTGKYLKERLFATDIV